MSTIYPSREAYYADHVACPSCGYSKNSQTLVGHVFIAGQLFQDKNKVGCRCGWTGTVDELNPLRSVDDDMGELPSRTCSAEGEACESCQ